MQCNDYNRIVANPRWYRETDLPCQNPAAITVDGMALCEICAASHKADHPDAVQVLIPGVRDNLGPKMEITQLWCKRGDRYGDWYIVRLTGKTVIAAALVCDGEEADNARMYGFLNDGMLMVDMNNHRDAYQLLSDEEVAA